MFLRPHPCFNLKHKKALCNYKNRQNGQVNLTRANRGNKGGYYSETGSGLAVPPKTVLVASLVFIGLVVVLHILDKLGRSVSSN